MFNEEQHIENLLRWLIDEVMSAGGDGDALWYSRNSPVQFILPYVEKLNKELNLNWLIATRRAKDGQFYIAWYRGQESLIITNSKEMWDNRPSWQQCSIDW